MSNSVVKMYNLNNKNKNNEQDADSNKPTAATNKGHEGGNCDNGSDNKGNNSKRRSRAQLVRKEKCGFPGCDRVYASKHSVRLHYRLKHGELSKFDMEIKSTPPPQPLPIPYSTGTIMNSLNSYINVSNNRVCDKKDIDVINIEKNIINGNNVVPYCNYTNNYNNVIGNNINGGVKKNVFSLVKSNNNFSYNGQNMNVKKSSSSTAYSYY
eukprot:Pgem_evm1s5528